MSSSIFQPNKATQQFLQAHWHDEPAKLALQANRYPNVSMAWVVQQVQGRRKAKAKLPTWYANERIVYPPSLAMEQCSSEATAAYKARICGGECLVDLTGGLGVDTAFMSASFNRTVYVERNEQLAAVAKHNFGVLGLAIEVHMGDGVELLKGLEGVNCLYLDPARRKGANQKAVLLTDCEPNILELKELLTKKSKRVLVKLSPLFDIAELLRFFPNAYQVHIVAVANECKELLLLLDSEGVHEPEIVCVNLQKDGSEQLFRFRYRQEATLPYNLTDEPLAYLYEPNASIQKSGGIRSYAKTVDAAMLHPNSRLLTSENKIADFQGRIFKVETTFGFSKAELKQQLGDIKQANITVRNFPLSVEELRKKLGLKDGGDTYLFATTLASGKKALVRCRKDS